MNETKKRLTELKDRQAQLRAELEAVKKAIESNAGLIQLAERKLAIAKKGVAVTDHAIVRWLERSGQIDVEKIRKEIIEKVEPYMAAHHTGRFPVGFGLQAQVKEKTVVTVVPATNKPHKD